MSELARFDVSGEATVIVMDDGKQNVVSPAMLRALHQALNHAEREKRVVLLKGREGIFSAGFDLKVFRDGTTHAIYDMLRVGAELALRVLELPLPIAAMEIAASLARIDFASHAATKLRARRPAIAAVREAINAEITFDAYRRRGMPASMGAPA